MSSETVEQLGENAVIERLVAGLPLDEDRVVKGAGDDCAVLRTADADTYQLQKTDCVIEGVHFLTETEPARVGWKAVARCVSDIAAMGSEARPVSALITIAVNKTREVAELEGWYEGIRRCADQFNFSIVGGETASLPDAAPAMISVAIFGEVPVSGCVFRSGAKVGDYIAVSGRLGGSFESGRHLDFLPQIGFAPDLRPTAMMDLSDGLAQDLPKLAAASGVGCRLNFEKIPCHENCDLEGALTDGEDYELLMTLPELPRENSGVTVIGQITETIETPLKGGWDHFRS